MARGTRNVGTSASGKRTANSEVRVMWTLETLPPLRKGVAVLPWVYVLCLTVHVFLACLGVPRLADHRSLVGCRWSRLIVGAPTGGGR